jgi:hypothetical protein
MRTLIKAYLRRGAILWLTMRLCVSAVAAFGGEDPFHVAPTTILTLIVGSAALMLVDIRRRNERMLIGNLGWRPSVLSCLALIPAAIGELAIHLAARSVA